MKHIDLRKCSASEFITYYNTEVPVKDLTASGYQDMRKTAGFFMSLVPLATKFGSTVAKAVLPFAAISGVLSGVSAEGGIQDKAMTGLEETGKQLMSPKKLFSNLVGFSMPSAGVSKLMSKSNGIAKTLVSGAAGMAGGTMVDKLVGNEQVPEDMSDPFMS